VGSDAWQKCSANLARLGHAEGRDFVFEARWAEGKVASLPALV
jgi:hypothetical protein